MKGPVFFIAVVVAICAWCPWYDQTVAQKLIATKTKEYQSYSKYCILTADPKTIHKVLFGYGEDVAYSCSIIENEPITTGKNIVVATFFGTIFNMPQPSFK